MWWGIRKPRAAALLAVVLAALVLAVMLKALVSLAQNRAFISQGYHQRATLHYVFEAAVNDALAQLEQDPTWNEGFENKQLADVGGFYDITFNTTRLNVAAAESVNNLTSFAPAEGPRGVATVPRLSAELVVRARTARSQRSARVVVGRTAFDVPPYAVTASGSIKLQGQVEVQGLESLKSSEEIPAGLHSNKSETGSEIISWQQKDPDDKASIAGTVSVVASSRNSIDFGGDPSLYDVDNFSYNTPAKQTPRLDITAEVRANLGHPVPDASGVGITRLGWGRHSSPGSLNIQGDLDLRGATLYVDGDLTVNGSIRGDGAIYVSGETHFKGDSQVRANNQSGVALFSAGSVHLVGFDGNELLAEVARTDPDLAQQLGHLDTVMRELHQRADLPVEELLSGGKTAAEVEALRVSLSEASGTPFPGTPNNILGGLRGKLQRLPQGSTKDFLLDRVQEGQKFFARNLSPAKYVIKSWNKGQNPQGFFRAALRHNSPQALRSAISQLKLLGFDRPGNSFFQGLLYTNGYIYATNEVTIVGATWAQDKGTQAPAVLDGTELHAGDVFLGDGVRLTLVEDYLATAGGEGAALPLGIKCWLVD